MFILHVNIHLPHYTPNLCIWLGLRLFSTLGVDGLVVISKRELSLSQYQLYITVCNVLLRGNEMKSKAEVVEVRPLPFWFYIFIGQYGHCLPNPTSDNPQEGRGVIIMVYDPCQLWYYILLCF